jgi:hypothetical protein
MCLRNVNTRYCLRNMQNIVTTAIFRSVLTLHVTLYSANSALLTTFRHVVLWAMLVVTDPHFVVVDT